MAEKVKIVGGDLDGSQLENAASEATLLLIKDAMNKLANIQNVSARNATRDITRLGGSAGDAADEIDELGGAFSLMGGPLKLLTGGFTSLVGGIGALVGAVGAGAEKMIKFSAGLIESQPNITDFTEAIADSKLNILGLGTAIDAATKILYGNYTTFQDLAKSGFQLGSQVSQLTGDITANRLTLQEFSQIAIENSENFAMFGNATAGLNKFLKLNSSAFKTNRDILQNWGVTFSEQGELFADFLGQNAYAMRRGTRTQLEVTALSADYATTLLKISSLTGKTLKQMQEDLGKQNLNNAFKSFLDTLPAEEAAKVNAMILAQQEQFGQDAADMAMAQVMGMAPMTKNSQIIAGIMPDLAANIQAQIDSSKNSTETLDQYSTDILNQNEKVANANLKMIEGYQTVTFALDAQGNQIGTVLQELTGNIRKASGAYVELNQKLDPAATAIAAFDTVMSNLRAAMGGWFTSFFNNVEVQKGLSKMTTWLINFDPTKYNPFNEEGRRNLMYSWGKLMENLGTMISNFWNGENGVALRNTIAGFFQGLITDLLEWLHETTGFFDESLERAKQGQAGYLSEAQRKQADLAGPDRAGLSEAQISYLDVKAKLAELEAKTAELNQQTQDARKRRDESTGWARRGTDIAYAAALKESEANALEIARLQSLTAGSIQTKAPEDYTSMFVGTQDRDRQGYANGTAGFENFGSGTKTVLHNSEAVIPRNTLAGDMLSKFFGNDWNNLKGGGAAAPEKPQPSQENTGKYIMQLNSTMLMVLDELRKGNDLEKRTLNSVKGLSGDLYRGI